MNVRNELEGIAYLTDCTLATVSSLAMKKSRSSSEYKRQISIAQKGYDMLVYFGFDFDVDPRTRGGVLLGRVKEIKYQFNGSVADWAKTYDIMNGVGKHKNEGRE